MQPLVEDINCNSWRNSRGQLGNPITNSAESRIASTEGPGGGLLQASGVVGRLRPVTNRLVQSLVRKVSAPLWSEVKRRATKRIIFGETATFFALVGVTLSDSEQGILTKSDEVEALCGNIRVSIFIFF